MSGKFVSKAVDENGDRLNVERVVQVGSGEIKPRLIIKVVGG